MNSEQVTMNNDDKAMGKAVLISGFVKGLITGFAAALIIFGLIAGLVYLHQRDRSFIEYVEKQLEIEELRKDINNLSADELLEIPDVRGAADGAAAAFERKRDEAVQRFRGGHSD
jgi:hypothetical protein